MKKPIYLDIMSADGTFIQQLRYDKSGFPEMIDGQVVECHKLKDIEEFVFSKRPSLRGKRIQIATSNQRIV